MTLQRTPLTKFTWSELGTDQQHETTIPTNIHLDLMAAGKIPDPFIGMNEKDVQWVHLKDWMYSCTFSADPLAPGERAALNFEGLDTFATVKLNGHEILLSDNMFVPYHVDISRHLQKENSLQIVFESAYNRGEELLKEHGQKVCWNGHHSRVYVRKAQYHYGWDWGPSLVTCGPWKSITLERYRARVEDLKVIPSVTDDLETASVDVQVQVDKKNLDHTATALLKDPSGNTVAEALIKDGMCSFKVSSPKLWYPFTHGEQPLYTVIVTLTSGSTTLDRSSKTVGLRRLQLIQSPLKEGSTFYFAMNNIPIFMGGSNWIPGDNFLPRMTPARYDRWIDLAVKGNHNMLRVWGGGIYEADAFYDACDRRGVLVWQDFCFACGQYPTYDAFIESVKREAVAALRRLRSHPSLAILAGNNEDYQVANEALHHDMNTPESEWLNTSFGARRTYERILPDLVKEHAPGVIYWPGSPWGGVDNNTDRRVGDVHIWNVSSGMLVPYQRYPDLAARFVSEFGMLSCPSVKTIKEAFFPPGDESDMHPQAEAFEHHTKAGSYEKRMFTCTGEQFRLSFDLDTYVYLTQLCQSEAMSFAFRGWRRKFEGRECSGALVWQTNDSWPANSWAVIDYYERPKPAYYTIARALAPLAVGVMRKPKHNPRPNAQHEALINGKTSADAAGIITHSGPHLYPPKESTFAVWIANATTSTRRVSVEVRFVSIATGKDIREAIRKTDVTVRPTGTTEVLVDQETPEDEPTVVAARIFDEAGTLIGRDADWPQPLKHITFGQRGVSVEAAGEEVIVKATRPTKGLFLLNDKVEWSDNCVDVIPGDEQRIGVKGLKGKVEYIYYGM